MRISDWSSDVCSSDLVPTQWSRGVGTLVLVRQWVENRDTGGGHWGKPQVAETRHIVATWPDAAKQMAEAQEKRDRKSVVEGKGVSVSVDFGGSRIMKKKKTDKAIYRTLNNIQL